MARLNRFLTILLLVAAASAQAPPIKRSELRPVLNLEAEHPNGRPFGWGAAPGLVFADGDVVHGGKWSARIQRSESSPGPFTTMTLMLPVDFAGKSIEFRGYVRTENVSGFAALWMREDGSSGSLAFDTTQNLEVKGTTDWKEYSIHVPAHPDGKSLFVGFLLNGTGKAWADDFSLTVDGKPIWDLPAVERPKTPLDTDTEFDGGSHVALDNFTPVQVGNLVALGKVWGFLKYHHPLITAGTRHWDYDLFRVMPAVLAAPDRAGANAAMLRWIEGAGKLEPCLSCARLEPKDLHLRPDVGWIADEAQWGAALSRKLREIDKNRPANGKQFYVSMNPGVANPSFDHEPDYGRLKLPDTGYQLLAVFRFWNIIQYWFPYRDVLGENWDAVLAEMIPRVGLAKDGDAYRREMIALIARAHDTHANLWSGLNVRPPVGPCRLPVTIRFVDQSAVVAQTPDGNSLLRGDVITAVDGEAVSKLVADWLPYYAASNEPTKLRDIARSMTNGACGEAKIKVRRGAEEIEVTASRTPSTAAPTGGTHDQAGDTFRLIADDIAYLKLSSIASADMARYIDSASKTKGLIIDIRNYPKEFVVFTLGALLVDRPTDFAIFTGGDLSNPGAFHFRPGDRITPKQPHYAGKVVILVDEVSQSQAEYTTMAFRTAPNAKVIGSTTAGADGNVSPIPLPGGLRSMISGIGVFYPDKRSTQRIGILPDIEVKPTIEGLREGRDELVEAAIRAIRGQ